MTFFPDLKTFMNIGGITITWYAIFVLGGAMLVYWLTSRVVRKWGYKDSMLEDFFIMLLPIAILGARLYYVIFEWQYYMDDPISILYIWEGGLAIHGGIIAGVLFGYCYFKKHQVDALRLADIIFPFMMIGQAIGRWGNFMNQEAYGSIVDPSFFHGFPKFIADNMFIDGYYRMPTFLIEGVGNLIGFVLIYFIYRKYGRKKRGDLAYAYFVWYGMIRFFVEAFRTDSLMLGNLKVAQLISLALVAFGLLGIFGLYNKLFKNIYPFKALKPTVIFDVDGTLLNTKSLVYASFQHAFQVFKPEYELTDEELRSFFGPTLQESFSKYLPQEQVEAAITCYREYYDIHYNEYVTTIKHAPEVLKTLSEQGYPLAVMSNKYKPVIDKGLKIAQIDQYFEVVLGSEEIEQATPSIKGLLKACELLHTGIDRVVYIGDNVIDVETCKNMSAFSIAYACDDEEYQKLKAVNPKALITDLNEIVDILAHTQEFSDDF